MLAVLLAQTGGTPGFTTGVTQTGAPLGPVAVALVLGLAALVPLALMVGTSFVKISVVFGLLRNALGTPQAPSGAVVTALAAILSLHVMAPTGAAVATAVGPYLGAALAADPGTAAGRDALGRALTAGRAPVARFLRANASARDQTLFLDLARRARAGSTQTGTTVTAPHADDLAVLLPAFLVSELTTAFAIGFLVYLPFLVVDLVVANLLVALGLTSVAPGSVALPFKLLLFVLADGWYLLARALVLGYR